MSWQLIVLCRIAASRVLLALLLPMIWLSNGFLVLSLSFLCWHGAQMSGGLPGLSWSVRRKVSGSAGSMIVTGGVLHGFQAIVYWDSSTQSRSVYLTTDLAGELTGASRPANRSAMDKAARTL